MSENEAQKAFKQLKERNDELYRTFQEEFKRKIATGEPEEGVTRIQLLEQMVHTMNSDIIASNLKFVSGMIESLNEDEIIESKKENSQRKE